MLLTPPAAERKELRDRARKTDGHLYWDEILGKQSEEHRLNSEWMFMEQRGGGVLINIYIYLKKQKKKQTNPSQLQKLGDFVTSNLVFATLSPSLKVLSLLGTESLKR